VRVISVTNSLREIVELAWLQKAERVHRMLRPQLPEGSEEYVEKMKKVFASGGEMLVAVRLVDGEERVVGLAVYREYENTFVGKRIYVDDLVTDETLRSTGVGHALLAQVEQIAQQRGAPGFDLESGTQRTRAHRFYFREGMYITSFSFRKNFTT